MRSVASSLPQWRCSLSPALPFRPLRPHARVLLSESDVVLQDILYRILYVTVERSFQHTNVQVGAEEWWNNYSSALVHATFSKLNFGRLRKVCGVVSPPHLI